MKTPFLLATFCICTWSSAQTRYSLATGLSLLRNLSPQQKFWAIGQQVQGNIHFSPKETGYVSLEYYKERRFSNKFIATAKSPFTTPETIAFNATGWLRYRQLSLGLKHYFRGSYAEKDGLNVFGTAGFGFLFARARNSSSAFIDTTVYSSPVLIGQGSVRRLTFDAGLGAEMNVGSFLFFFGNVRTWLPASHQPSRMLHNSDRVPLSLMAGAGIRILFGYTY